jgi:hypothetical protein
MKSFRTFIRACIIISSIGGAYPAVAQPSVKLEHDSSWTLVRRQCTIRARLITNLTGEETPPLFLSVYARSDAGYDGFNSPGILVARAPIGTIPANGTLNDIMITAKARNVPPGERFTALMVETQNGKKFSIVDYVVFTSTYAFPRGMTGGVGSDDAAIGTGNVSLVASTPLAVQRRRAEFTIDQIQNQREDAVTGPLRIAIYATPEPYTGASDYKVIGATKTLGFLAQGDYYNQLQGKLTLKRPGRGTFYLALVVEEDSGSGFAPVVYINEPDPAEF